jgi:hypothetical protein
MGKIIEEIGSGFSSHVNILPGVRDQRFQIPMRYPMSSRPLQGHFDEKPGEWFSVQKPCHHALMSSGEFLRLKLAGRSQTEHRRINDLPLQGKSAANRSRQHFCIYVGTYMALYHYLYIPIIHL